MSKYIKTLDEFIFESGSTDPYNINTLIFSPAFKPVLDKGWKVTSTGRQIKNGTLAMLSPAGFTIYFMAQSITVRKSGKDRLGRLIQYENLSTEKFWENAIDLLLNKIDIVSGTMSKQASKEAKIHLRGLINDVIASLQIDDASKALFTKYISYSNNKGHDEDILKSIKEVFHIKEDSIDMYELTRHLKINTAKIINEYQGPKRLNIIAKGYIEANVLSAATTRPGDHVRLYRGDEYDLSIDRTSYLSKPYYIWNWVRPHEARWSFGRYSIRILGCGQSEIKIVAPPVPTERQLRIHIRESENLTLHLDFDINQRAELFVGSQCTLKTNADPNMFDVYIGSSYDLNTYKKLDSATDQYKVRFLNAQGQAHNRDHDVDLNTVTAISDLW